jgi:hypothetical protein
MEQGADGCSHHAQSIGCLITELKEIRIIATAHIQGPKLNHWASDATAPSCLCMVRAGGVQVLVDDAIDDAVAPSISAGSNPLQLFHVTASDRPSWRDGGWWMR